LPRMPLERKDGRPAGRRFRKGKKPISVNRSSTTERRRRGGGNTTELSSSSSSKEAEGKKGDQLAWREVRKKKKVCNALISRGGKRKKEICSALTREKRGLSGRGIPGLFHSREGTPATSFHKKKGITSALPQARKERPADFPFGHIEEEKNGCAKLRLVKCLTEEKKELHDPLRGKEVFTPAAIGKKKARGHTKAASTPCRKKKGCGPYSRKRGKRKHAATSPTKRGKRTSPHRPPQSQHKKPAPDSSSVANIAGRPGP